MKNDKRDHTQLIIMLGAWVLGAIMLGIIVWEIKRLGVEVHIL